MRALWTTSPRSSETRPTFYSPLTFWTVSVSFVLFQFFLQLSTGVVITSIMKELALSASQAGLLASAYYYVYTALQIPVGMLFDRKNTRFLLTINAFICSLGCILFAMSQDFVSLMISRLIIGTGSAFAFIGVSHILRLYFPLNQFGLMIGLSETLAFFVTVLFMVIMGTMVDEVHWRHLMLYSGFIGLTITMFCALLIPNEIPIQHEHHSVWQALTKLCRNKAAWANGIYAGLGFSYITVFGAMWAIPFFQVKMGCDLQMASVLDAMVFLGAGMSCPLFGKIEARASKRRPILFCSYFFTALLLIVVLFAPITSLFWMGGCLFLMGLTSGAYMITYSIANEISPANALSTSTGFTNTLAVLTAPLFQPVIGYLLDMSKQSSEYSLANYQFALMVVPIGLMIGASLVWLLPEKRG